MEGTLIIHPPICSPARSPRLSVAGPRGSSTDPACVPTTAFGRTRSIRRSNYSPELVGCNIVNPTRRPRNAQRSKLASRASACVQCPLFIVVAQLTLSRSYWQCYFLNFGNADHPILYSVQRLRDGRSYSTRTVLATQNGVPIFSLTCSFCVPEPQQPRTVLPLPAWPLKLGALGRIEDIPSPEECPPTEDRLAVLMDQKELPGKVKD